MSKTDEKKKLPSARSDARDDTSGHEQALESVTVDQLSIVRSDAAGFDPYDTASLYVRKKNRREGC